MICRRIWARPTAPPTTSVEDRRVHRRRHGREPHALIETLHTVQESFGYLDETALRFVASTLRVPLSRVYGAATFYHFFTLKPQGQTHLRGLHRDRVLHQRRAGPALQAIERLRHQAGRDHPRRRALAC